jgi:membrane protease YdiL (CAAX protease family)
MIQQQMEATKQIQAWKAAHPGQKMPDSARPHNKSPFGFVPGLVIGSDATQFFGMFALAWLLARAERRKLGWFGIGPNRMRDFLPGACWGLVALSVLVFLLHSLHLLYFDNKLLSGSALVLYGIKWLIAFLFVGFAEEYFLRGYMQFTLSRGVYGLAEKISPNNARAVAFWIAAFLLSIGFACLHLGNNGENAFGILLVFVVGMVFAYVLYRTGSLWWAIGFHMAWDWAQSFLYGVPDSGNLSVGRLFQTHYAGNTLLSGGSDGPEGSLLCIPVLLLMVLVVRYTTKPAELPPLEQLPRA